MRELTVELRDVKRHYNVGGEIVRALDGVSFEVEKGDFLAIMGASGSGKSTLLNILGCLDKPTDGEYWLGGANAAAMDDNALSWHRLNNLGFVFQSFHLLPQLNVAENIALPLFYCGMPYAERMKRARELAADVGMEHRLRHKPSELSGGQCQRVAIARALANNPPVILADEPTGNLDTATSVQIMELLTALNREGRTILMVTHEDDIATFARKRIVLKDGKVAAEMSNAQVSGAKI